MNKDLKKYGDFENVLLTDEEYKKLRDKFGAKTEEKINDLSYYLESKKVTYKSHYAVILNWHRRDMKKFKEKNGFNNFNSTGTSSYEVIKTKSLERVLNGKNGMA